MRFSTRLKDERNFVARTYATTCTAELSDMCPGFVAIEKAKEDFAKQENAQ